MGRKSKQLSPDRREVIVNLTTDGYEISRILSEPESTCKSVIKPYKTAHRKDYPRKVSVLGEAGLLRLVKMNHEKVFKRYYQSM